MFVGPFCFSIYLLWLIAVCPKGVPRGCEAYSTIVSSKPLATFMQQFRLDFWAGGVFDGRRPTARGAEEEALAGRSGTLRPAGAWKIRQRRLTRLRSASPRAARRGGGEWGWRNRKRGGGGSRGPGWRRRGSQQEQTDRKRRRKRGGRDGHGGQRPFAGDASEDRPILPHKGLLFLYVLVGRLARCILQRGLGRVAMKTGLGRK